MHLQEEPSVARLIAWVRACEAEGVDIGTPLAAREVAELLDGALGETLIDDLSFLSLHLEKDGGRGRSQALAEFLRSRLQLPESGAFSEFLAITHEALDKPGWKNRPALSSPEWLRGGGWTFSRRAFLAWLGESTDSRERIRGADGNHFYGKVHLLIYAQMPGQTWTHLIPDRPERGRLAAAFRDGRLRLAP